MLFAASEKPSEVVFKPYWDSLKLFENNGLLRGVR